jgi:hypothetical protein
MGQNTISNVLFPLTAAANVPLENINAKLLAFTPNIVKILIVIMDLTPCILKTGATLSSGTIVTTYKSTRCNNPEDICTAVKTSNFILERYAYVNAMPRGSLCACPPSNFWTNWSSFIKPWATPRLYFLHSFSSTDLLLAWSSHTWETLVPVNAGSSHFV